MDKIKLLWSKTNRWHRAFFVLAVVESRIVPGGQVGFQCNDPALSHPFSGDTISFKVLMATTVLLPLAVMLLVERIYHNDKTVKHKQAICWFREYLFGVMMNLVIVQALKLMVGSPRPHFFDTCSPKEALTCQGTEYVSNYTCTKAYWLNQSDRSFPSGHTSLAVHAGLFLAYYLHRRTSCPGTSKIIILQALCVAAAVICGVSRMIDHRHHWWDVLAGVVIAAPILFWTFRVALCAGVCAMSNGGVPNKFLKFINSLCGNFECANKTSTTGDPTSINTGVVNVPLINKET